MYTTVMESILMKAKKVTFLPLHQFLLAFRILNKSIVYINC